MSTLSEIMKSRVKMLMGGERKEILLSAISDEITPKQAISVNCLIGTGGIGKNSAEGFDRVTKDSPLQFPKDHYTHKNMAMEWYMGGGTLKCAKIDTSGNIIGEPLDMTCIFTFFFRRIEPGDKKMILETHFSLVQVGDTHIQSEPNAHWNFDDPLDLPDSETRKFIIKSPHLQIISLREDEAFFKHINVQGTDSHREIAINLNLKRVHPFFFQGGNGHIGDLENGLAYGYYSVPNLDVSGTLIYKNEDYRILDGKFGMDHEWGTMGRPLTKKIQILFNILYAIGWNFRFLDVGFGLSGYENWFCFEFDDGTYLTSVNPGLKKLGLNEWFAPDPSISQMLSPDGIQSPISNLKFRILEFADIEGSKYPIKFEFTGAPVGDFFVKSVVPDQRMEWAGGGYGYEGGTIVTDRFGKQIGTGILENCGWDEKFTEHVLIKLGIDESKAILFNSRNKKRGCLLTLGLFSILAGIIGIGIWGLFRIFS